MSDDLVAQAVEDGDDEAIRAILTEVCALTEMGFAAVARVTEDRWIACQVLDRVEFGLTPGGELVVANTICNEIRDHGEAVVFDDATVEPDWCNHPVPILYGFRSYCSLPIRLSDGSFYGTLCAIDPQKRRLNAAEVIAALRDCADRVARIIDEKQRARA